MRLKILHLKGEVITTPFTFAATTNAIALENLVSCGSLIIRFVFIFFLLCAAVSFGDTFVPFVI